MTNRSFITIKGTKDGLVFHFDDACSYEELIADLKEKLLQTHYRFLESTTITRVQVKIGYRFLSNEQEEEIKEIIRLSKGNFVVEKIDRQVLSKEEWDQRLARLQVQMVYKTIRSGQSLDVQGNLFIIGDVNPGASIQATGNVYVLGAIRGMVHAGCAGDEQAIIAASKLNPTQLRIAGRISRPPDEWEHEEYEMEFAYLEQEQIHVDKLAHLVEVRPLLPRLL